MQFSLYYSTFKVVGKKERIARIKAISRGYQRRRMFSECLQMYVALRRRRMILLLSLTGLLLVSSSQNIATGTAHLRSCRRLPRNNREFTQIRRRQQQERHKFAYLIMKNNSSARFARAVFIFDISQTFSFFLRRERTCFAVVWTT